MKNLMFILTIFFLISFAFADPLTGPPDAVWQTSGIAIAISLTLVGLIYAIGTGFSVHELQFLAKEELFQVIAVAVMVAVLFGANGLLNALSTNVFFSQGQPTMQLAAEKVLETDLSNTATLLNTIGDYDSVLSFEASKSYSCSVSSLGYTVSACGGYNMLATPISMAGSISGFAVGELSAMKRLLDISQKYAILLFLPFGIILRTFKLTRGAGGLLIAVAISLHILLPIGILFNDALATNFITAINGNNPDLAQAKVDYTPGNLYPAGSLPTCDSPGDTTNTPQPTIYQDLTKLSPNDLNTLAKGDNEERAIAAYAVLRNTIRSELFVILINATFGPVIALLLVAAGIRAISALAGADVDVSAISRFV